MVHRRLILRPAAVPLLAATLLLALATLSADRAGAANARVAIANYMWTPAEIDLDLGEHVTWYWTGPDTMHSVTGTSANAKDIDTDPQSRLPEHALGDSFQHTFDQPGTYRFHCKLHTLVQGTVIVSDRPGDPITEPDPVPKINVDRSKPVLRDVRLGASKFGRKGTSLKFSLNDRGRLDAEYFRYGRKGKRHQAKRSFAGWAKWKAYIGWNGVRIGGRSKNFKPRPGRYEAVLRAIDQTENESKPKRVRFTIRRR